MPMLLLSCCNEEDGSPRSLNALNMTSSTDTSQSWSLWLQLRFYCRQAGTKFVFTIKFITKAISNLVQYRLSEVLTECAA